MYISNLNPSNRNPSNNIILITTMSLKKQLGKNIAILNVTP